VEANSDEAREAPILGMTDGAISSSLRSQRMDQEERAMKPAAAQTGSPRCYPHREPGRHNPPNYFSAVGSARLNCRSENSSNADAQHDQAHDRQDQERPKEHQNPPTRVTIGEIQQKFMGAFVIAPQLG
jgi:hypothetical protein